MEHLPPQIHFLLFFRRMKCFLSHRSSPPRPLSLHLSAPPRPLSLHHSASLSQYHSREVNLVTLNCYLYFSLTYFLSPSFCSLCLFFFSLIHPLTTPYLTLSHIHSHSYSLSLSLSFSLPLFLYVCLPLSPSLFFLNKGFEKSLLPFLYLFPAFPFFSLSLRHSLTPSI